MEKETFHGNSDVLQDFEKIQGTPKCGIIIIVNKNLRKFIY
jgi:hypothetical protein